MTEEATAQRELSKVEKAAADRCLTFAEEAAAALIAAKDHMASGDWSGVAELLRHAAAASSMGAVGAALIGAVEAKP